MMGDGASPPSSSVDEDFPFAISESLVPTRDRKEASLTKVTVNGLLAKPLLLKEDLKDGCGGQLWPAGILLSDYMLREHRSDLRGKTIVELGAGVGLVGLVVASGCSIDTPLFITDQVPMLSLMEDNIQLNDLCSQVRAAVLDWGSDIPQQIPLFPDVILAADCVYFEPTFPLLLHTLERLIGPGSVCYFCFKRRRRADLRFVKNLKKTFHVREIHHYPGCNPFNRENLFLYIVKAKPRKAD